MRGRARDADARPALTWPGAGRLRIDRSSSRATGPCPAAGGLTCACGRAARPPGRRPRFGPRPSIARVRCEPGDAARCVRRGRAMRSHLPGPAAAAAMCWSSTTPRSSRRSCRGGACATAAAAHRARRCTCAIGAGPLAAFARPAKRVEAGDRIVFGEDGERLPARRLRRDGRGKGARAARCCCLRSPGPALDEAIARGGHMPLPPYIAAQARRRRQRPRRLPDDFAREEGAVAAPTAGLHFTPELFGSARCAGVEHAFRDAACRRRHLPAGEGGRHRRPQDACRMGRRLRRRPPRRAERRQRAAAAGSSPSAPRRCGCSKAPPTRMASSAPVAATTDIFITPGYRFRAVDVLMTNFHLPRSTLFMLVSAFCRPRDACGRPMPHAIEHGYRFYSYGDASLLFRPSLMNRAFDHLHSRRADGAGAPRRDRLPRGRSARRPSCRSARPARSRRCTWTRCASSAPTSSSATPIT